MLGTTDLTDHDHSVSGFRTTSILQVPLDDAFRFDCTRDAQHVFWFRKSPGDCRVVWDGQPLERVDQFGVTSHPERCCSDRERP
jgi:hypothetical protein